MKIKITIYEDHSNLREALKTMLNATNSFEVVSTHPNCKNALLNTVELNPDIILMDIDMPEVNGIDGLKIIKEKHPHIRVIILTVFEDDEKIFQAFKAGADGYLLKNSVSTQLIPSLNETIIGGTSISPGIALRVLNNFKNNKVDIEFNLLDIEAQVLELTIVGFTYNQLANYYKISEENIRQIISEIHIKLQLNEAPAGLRNFLEGRLKK
jgi:DNA-binding NarL/FixJ family response regulator